MNKKEKEQKKSDKVEVYKEKLKEQIQQQKVFDRQLVEDMSPADIISSVFSSERDQEKDKIIEILFEHPDLRKIADITHDDLINITVLHTFADHVKTPLITHFCEHYLALSLSKDRKSREEVVEIYKTQVYGAMEGMYPEQQGGRFSRLRDRLNL